MVDHLVLVLMTSGDLGVLAVVGLTEG